MKWRERECCLRAHGTAAMYFGPGELTVFHCPFHGDVRVRSERQAGRAYQANVGPHVGGVLAEHDARNRRKLS